MSDHTEQNSGHQNSGFNSFKAFYPYYLSEHEDINCRRLHFAGSWLVLAIIAAAIIYANARLLLLVPVAGYGFAWVGHFFFEHNRPATFKYPFYSLMGDWVMFADILRGRVKV